MPDYPDSNTVSAAISETEEFFPFPNGYSQKDPASVNFTSYPKMFYLLKGAGRRDFGLDLFDTVLTGSVDIAVLVGRTNLKNVLPA